MRTPRGRTASTLRQPLHCVSPRAVLRESPAGRAGFRLPALAVLLVFFAAVQPGARAQFSKLVPSAPAAASQNAGQPPQGGSVPSSSPQATAQPIPLPQIAGRAEELDHLLREINNQLASKEELVNAAQQASEAAEEIRRRDLETRDLLAGNPTPVELEDARRYWRAQSAEYTAERKRLTERAARLEERLRLLDAQQAEWLATWNQIHNTPGIQAVTERIRSQLDAIEATRTQALEQLSLALTLQNQVSQQDHIISDTLLRVQQTRERARGRLLQRDGRPLWQAPETQLGGADLSLRRSFGESFVTVGEFLAGNKLSLFILLAAYSLVLLGALELRTQTARSVASEAPGEAAFLLKRPFSLALLVVLLGSGELASSAPIGITFVFYLLYLIPVLRLLVPLIPPRLRVFVYVLAAFYVLTGANVALRFPQAVRRETHALLILGALAAFSWLARPLRLRELQMPRRTLLMFTVAVRVCLALLALSFMANVAGFVAFAQVLGLAALLGPFVACCLYCGVRVLKLIVNLGLRTLWARNLLETRAAALERWSGNLLATAAAFLWVRLMLRLFTVYDGVRNVAISVFRYPIGVEKMQFTLGDALGLMLVLLGGYALANGITFLMKRVVLPRLPLKRGVPYAISTVTYYFLLLLVALAGLSAAGVDMSKFTVLTGALGVGLGFGLQNIVNNFVSGLILLFERPIHVGDTVEVGGLVGIVRRIGARSSTVVTYQGAEVIVPNSNLLSNQVINWTLSSQLRRVDVRVMVAHGTDPEQVIKLLVGVAESHPGVLLDRPPAAFFMGFGDSALNFELRFWCDRQDAWFQLQSDVTVAIAKALREAGIQIPFPQRDLHLRSVSASAGETLLREGLSTASSANLTARAAPR